MQCRQSSTTNHSGSVATFVVVLLPAVAALTYIEAYIAKRAREVGLMPVLAPRQLPPLPHCIADNTLQSLVILLRAVVKGGV